MARLVVIEVIVAELGDMQQTFDINIVERNEQTEAGHAGHGAIEFLADLVLHEIAFEPCLHIAGRIIGSPLGHRAVLPQLFPVAGIVFAALKHRLDGAVYEQIRVAADRRCEVGIRFVSQTEMADIIRAVDRLLHGAQQHGL